MASRPSSFPGLEFDSSNLLSADLHLVSLGIGEWTEVQKAGTPKAYSGTYRLETNDQLYEGVRFAFLTVSAAPSQPFNVSMLRAVSQAKPVNYLGSFSAPGDDLLTRIWYTAVFTVRLNLETDYIGAILVDRGDRCVSAGDWLTVST